MLNFDNTVNYAPTFKKINESIESINTLLTSLLLDTYTNQTFIYSDINVIRVNTSQNYDSIQSLSGGLPLKLDSSVSTNFFMKTNSVQFASQSTMSDKMNVSDFDSVSGNYFMKSNSTIFASSSTLSNKFNVSDSSQFALNSSVSAQLDNKLDKTDFSIYSLDFASTSDLASKLDASESTYFLPSSDFTIPTFSAEYLSNLSNFIETTMDDFGRKTSSMTFTNLMYNMIPTSFSGSVLEINNQPLLYNLSLTGRFSGTNNTIRNFSISSGRLSITGNSLQGTFINNNMTVNDCSLNGVFKSNVISASYSALSLSGQLSSNKIHWVNRLDLYMKNDSNGSNTFSEINCMNVNFQKINDSFINNTLSSMAYFNATNGSFASCSFEYLRNCELSNAFSTINHDTFSSITNLCISCNEICTNTFTKCLKMSLNGNGTYNNFNNNSLSSGIELSLYNFDLQSNTFTDLTNVLITNARLTSNSFNYVNSLTIKLPLSSIYNSPVAHNTFNNMRKLVFDIDYYTKTYTNDANSIVCNYVEFNIGPNVETFNMGSFIGLHSNQCFIGGLNINIPENAKNYTLTREFIKQLVFSNTTNWSRNHLISFNSTNRWINSGFNTTLSSYCDIGLLAEHSGTTEYDVQGSVSSTVAPVEQLNYRYLQPKFSPNYDSVKHYMIVYSNSFRDYYEMDPHALEAGHNNNACENILLIRDFSFYSTLPNSYGSYTFIQWPSTRMTLNKECFSNNTLLNTISNLTSRLQQGAYTDFEYSIGGTGNTYNYLSYRVSSSQLSVLFNTSSSSQLFAGFSTSGTFDTLTYVEILKR